VESTLLRVNKGWRVIVSSIGSRLRETRSDRCSLSVCYSEYILLIILFTFLHGKLSCLCLYNHYNYNIFCLFLKKNNDLTSMLSPPFFTHIVRTYFIILLFRIVNYLSKDHIFEFILFFTSHKSIIAMAMI